MACFHLTQFCQMELLKSFPTSEELVLPLPMTAAMVAGDMAGIS